MKTTLEQLIGTGVALVTPFDAAGQIDWEALHKLLEFTAKGVDYWVVNGTTGEAPVLSKEERKHLLAFVKSHNPKHLPIVWGIGGNNTREVIAQIKETDFEGVAAILSVSPYYNKPSQEGIYQHYLAIAETSPVPVLLYNVPSRTGANVSASTVIRLAAHPNIIGIKDAAGDFEQYVQIAKNAPANFLLISGDDMLTVPLISIGGKGVISVLANAFPVSFSHMTRQALQGNFAQAAALLYQFAGINPLLYKEGSPAGIKYVLSQLGICSPYLRLPHVMPSENLRSLLEAALETIPADVVIEKLP
ncbi:MAG: 4-hydroxy-tetrahydrodipicolinate synthase [Cytophagales bacterium]|nr:4-hydroxy-tetrahydrodipicolinate synthase [Bernardetiaceae bacterium]MDW8210077.1 4-hydroxy-tetrahydrodipicolinate synthase [Cytophagales bacterium]